MEFLPTAIKKYYLTEGGGVAFTIAIVDARSVQPTEKMFCTAMTLDSSSRAIL